MLRFFFLPFSVLAGTERGGVRSRDLKWHSDLDDSSPFSWPFFKGCRLHKAKATLVDLREIGDSGVQSGKLKACFFFTVTKIDFGHLGKSWCELLRLKGANGVDIR